MQTDERSELRGSVLEDRYQVGACIGVGGTGVVFEATRLADGAVVALKALRPSMANDPNLRTRLRREAEVARAVHHPGILPVSDVGVLPDGSPYLVMRRVHGESLWALLRRRGHLEADEVAVIAARVASILHHVHAAGYVHRDVKPEHVVLDRTSDGELVVTLLDFGVCASDRAPVEEREAERGRVYGTPSYASPEQASGNPYVDGRADLWGLGVTLYEALTGRLPYRGSTVMNLLRNIIGVDAPAVSAWAPDVPEALAAIVHRLLARPVDARFPSGRSVARAIVDVTPERAACEARLAHRLLSSVYAPAGQSTATEAGAVDGAIAAA